MSEDTDDIEIEIVRPGERVKPEEPKEPRKAPKPTSPPLLLLDNY